MRFTLLAVALLAAPAAAQDDAPIVVIGQKDVEKQIENFVGALTQASPRGQIARFETAVCPGAFGMPDAQRAAVGERIRTVAAGVGIKVEKADCRPNLVVIVTPDKAAFLKALGKKHQYMFGDRSAAEIRRISAEPGPAAAWQIQEMVTLTQWDFSFLKGLYSRPNNLYAPSQRSEIGRVMAREMEDADDGKNRPPDGKE
jgi:hypothetical protein